MGFKGGGDGWEGGEGWDGRECGDGRDGGMGGMGGKGVCGRVRKREGNGVCGMWDVDRREISPTIVEALELVVVVMLALSDCNASSFVVDFGLDFDLKRWSKMLELCLGLVTKRPGP